MKLRTYDALIVEGYEPEVLVKSENCPHVFTYVLVFYPKSDNHEIKLKCEHCGIDDHGALMQGWKANYYNYKPGLT